MTISCLMIASLNASTFSVSIDVNKDLTLDLSLTDEPVVDVSSLNVGLKVGQFI